MKTTVSSSATRQTRCAIYTRKSTDEGLDRDFNSLDAQREAAEAYVGSQKHEGWIALPDHYDDGGFTGANMERPALKRLLQDVEKGLVDTILVYKVDRLSRSLIDFARMMDVLERHGVSFVSVTQHFDTSTPMGRLTLNVLLSFAQFEREMITDRVRDAVAGAKRKGKFTGGTPAFGYDVDREAHKLVVNPTEAKTVRHIFKRFAEVGSGLTIAKELNAKGITTKSWITRNGKRREGKPWNASLIYRMLSNRLYLGETLHKGQSYPGEHEAIISQRQWDAAQAMISANPRKTQRSHESVPALLGGIIRCRHCDRAMTSTYTRKRGRTYRYYVCTKASKNGYDSCPVKTVAAGDIEQAVINQIGAIFRTPEMMAQTYIAAKQIAAEEEPDLVPSQWEVIDALKKFDPIWKELNPAEQRRIVGCLVERVTVGIDDLDVRLRTDGIHSILSSLENTHDESERNNEQ